MATIGYREETGAGIVRAAVAATFGGRGVAANPGNGLTWAARARDILNNRAEPSRAEPSRALSSCPPGRVMPRPSRGRPDWPPESSAAARRPRGRPLSSLRSRAKFALAALVLGCAALLGVASQAQAQGAADTTPPALDSATVLAADAGAVIELTFDEAYDLSGAALLNASTAFSVTADGNSVTVGGLNFVVEADGITYKRIELGGLSPAITYGQLVTVSYKDPTTGDDTVAIQDAAGNDVSSFTTGSGGVPAVINNVPNTPPALDSATVLAADAGAVIELTFDEAYDFRGAFLLNASTAFSVIADGNSVTVGGLLFLLEADGTYKRLKLDGLSPPSRMASSSPSATRTPPLATTPSPSRMPPATTSPPSPPAPAASLPSSTTSPSPRPARRTSTT